METPSNDLNAQIENALDTPEKEDSSAPKISFKKAPKGRLKFKDFEIEEPTVDDYLEVMKPDPKNPGESLSPLSKSIGLTLTTDDYTILKRLCHRLGRFDGKQWPMEDIGTLPLGFLNRVYMLLIEGDGDFLAPDQMKEIREQN